MKTIMFAISLIFFIFIGFKSFEMLSQINDLSISFKTTTSEIASTNELLAKVRLAVSTQPTPLKDTFHSFINNVNIIAEYNNCSLLVNIPGYKESANVTSHFSKSDLDGIKKLSLLLVFTNIQDPYVAVSLISNLKEMSKNLTLTINSIHSENNSLVLNLNIYGPQEEK